MHSFQGCTHLGGPTRQVCGSPGYHIRWICRQAPLFSSQESHVSGSTPWSSRIQSCMTRRSCSLTTVRLQTQYANSTTSRRRSLQSRSESLLMYFMAISSLLLAVKERGSARRRSPVSAQSQLVANLDQTSQLDELGDGFCDHVQGHAPDSGNTSNNNILANVVVPLNHCNHCSDNDVAHGYLLCLLAVKERMPRRAS